MYKLAIFPLFFTAATAGYFGAAPALYGAGIGLGHASSLAASYAPVLANHVAPLPVATSHANTFRTTVTDPAFAGYAAPVAHAAPLAGLAHAAPLAGLAHAAPFAVAHGPSLAYSAPFAHSLHHK